MEKLLAIKLKKEFAYLYPLYDLINIRDCLLRWIQSKNHRYSNRFIDAKQIIKMIRNNDILTAFLLGNIYPYPFSSHSLYLRIYAYAHAMIVTLSLILHTFSKSQMCQFQCCECIWCNCFKICCPGISCHLFCCSIWCCKPEEFQSFDYNCITCCEKSGFGGVACLGLGLICCSPDWLISYSHKKTNSSLQSRENEYSN